MAEEAIIDSCASCGSPLFETFFELISSASACHIVCSPCFGIVQAERGCQPNFKCPDKDCNSIIVGHRCFTKRNSSSPIPGPVVKIAAPDPVLDPLRKYRLLPKDYQRKNILLVGSWIEEKQTFTTTSALVPIDEAAEEYDNDIKEKLLVLARILFHVIIAPANQFNDSRSRKNIDTIQKFEEYALQELSSFHVKFNVGLYTGKTIDDMLPDGASSNAYQRSNYFALYCGLELLRRSIMNRPGVLQDVIQRFLTVHQVPRAVKNELCRLRIASSREKIRLEDIEKVNNHLTKGWNIQGKKYWGLFITYDNLGFRILGARAGYDQYVTIVVQFISPHQLRKIGFYLPFNSGKQPISRTRRDWEQVKSRYRARDILPTESDYYSQLGQQVYSLIDALLQIINKIPSLEEARNLISIAGKFDVDARLPTEYGVQRRVDLGQSSNLAQVDIEQQEVYDMDDEHNTEILDGYTKHTMFSRDNIEIDLPMHADLNSKVTVRKLCDGAVQLRQQIINSSSSNEEEETMEQPLMQDLGVDTGADGSPVFNFLGLRDQTPEDFEHVYCHNGPFHKHMASLGAVGKMFIHTHLWYFLDGHRNTDPKKEFFLFPSDPGQTLHETPEMTAPHYIAAARSLSRIKDGQNISAVDVHDFMLERALEYDHCMIILMWLHFVETTNLIRDSEGENDPELYRCGARIAMFLFAKTHSTRYVRMGMEFFIRTETESEADRKMFDNFYFTKSTAEGHRIWFDRFVEWVNKDTRQYLGKYAKPNHEMLIQKTMLLQKEHKQRKAADDSRRSRHKQNHFDRPERVYKEIAISPIFCQQLDLIHQHNYWGEGPVVVGKNKLYVPTHFTDPTGEIDLNTEVLFNISAAEDSLQMVFQQCHFLTINQKKHSEMDSYLQITPAKLQDVAKTRDDELIQLTSTNWEDLYRVTTTASIKTRIKNLQQTYSNLNLPSPKAKLKKAKLCKHLASCYEKIIEQDGNFVKNIKDLMNQKYHSDGRFANKQHKEAELAKPFYSFTSEAKNHFFNRKFPVDIPTAINEINTPSKAATHVHDVQQQVMEEATPIFRMQRLSLE